MRRTLQNDLRDVGVQRGRLVSHGNGASLRARLLFLVALALVPAIALTAYSALEQRSAQTEAVEESNLRLANRFRAEHDGLVDSSRQVLTALSRTAAIRNQDPAQCAALLTSLEDGLPYSNAGVLDASGDVVCTAHPLRGSERLDEELARARAADGFVTSGYRADPERSVSALTMSLPLRDDGDDFDGILFATVETTWLLERVQQAELEEGTIFLVVDGGGRVIARHPPGTPDVGQGIGGTEFLGAVLALQQGVETTSSLDGTRRILAFSPMMDGPDPAFVAVGVPTSVAFAEVSHAFGRNLATLVLVGGLAFGATWVVSDRYILRDMRALVSATLRLRAGVLSARTGVARGHGEFSQLARWFDEMAASLEREHAELRRLGRLELYRLLAENATDLISRLTPQGSVLYASPAAQRILGYAPENLLGRYLTGLTHDEDVSSTREALDRALDAREHVTVTHRLRRRDGAFVWLESTLQAVRDPQGYATEIIAVSRDVTERVRVQAALEEARRASEAAAKAKSEFLANMSHEIRTPMNAVIGMTSLLSETPLDEEQREFVDTIRSSGDHLLTVINDILDFSKIESERLELERHPFGLRACVEESVDLVSASAAQKSVELVYDVEPDVPDALVGDAGRLRQVLVNLLSNAVKFTHEGEVVLTVRATPAADGRHELAFTVRDTGIGIPDDRVERLFRPFFQVDASTTRQYGGSGLGLAISKHLCDLMGGRIWAESEAGKGSAFHFTIVVDAGPEPAREREPEPGLAGRRVLVVDDNATNRRILGLQLERWGMIATAVPGADEALRLVKRGDAFDLAILDLRMPGLDGVGLARELRERRDDLPLVLLSSIGRARGATKETGVAFDATLSKPVKPQSLHDTLLRVFGASRTLRVAEPATFDPQLATDHPLRILLAEDNAVNQKVALRMLARLGYQADVAANGLEAVDAVRRQDYDLVLMDVQMPEMDGLEATRRIRALSHGRPRIAAMTAHASHDDRARCLAAGMDDHLTKPIHVDQLVAALRRAPARAPEGVTP